jgi:hypothetical protein
MYMEVLGYVNNSELLKKDCVYVVTYFDKWSVRRLVRCVLWLASNNWVHAGIVPPGPHAHRRRPEKPQLRDQMCVVFIIAI